MTKTFASGPLVLGSFGFGLLGAEGPFAGTWKLNVAKSKFAKGHEIKELTVTAKYEGDTAMVTANGMDGAGKAISVKYSRGLSKPSPPTLSLKLRSRIVPETTAGNFAYGFPETRRERVLGSGTSSITRSLRTSCAWLLLAPRIQLRGASSHELPRRFCRGVHSKALTPPASGQFFRADGSCVNWTGQFTY